MTKADTGLSDDRGEEDELSCHRNTNPYVYAFGPSWLAEPRPRTIRDTRYIERSHGGHHDRARFEGGAMTGTTLTECMLVPVADAEDARTTCRVLRAYEPDRVVAINVIEKAGGAPDKAGVEQRQEHAQGIFAAVEDGFADTDTDVETEIRYGTDVADAIVAAAADHGASAICFSPRKGGRWVRLLTGDVALSLVTESDRPVVVLPEETGETVTDGGKRIGNENGNRDTES